MGFSFIPVAPRTAPIMEENSRKGWSKWLKFIYFQIRQEFRLG